MNYIEDPQILKLKDFLTHEALPGPMAHNQMASDHRKVERQTPSQSARRAAVLILLSPFQDSFKFPLILRPAYDGVHGGQMAFPGGKVDQEDPSIIYAALRECDEEIGVKVGEEQVLGTLSDLYIPPSDMLVTPVVAHIDSIPPYIPDPKEVDRVYETTIQHLLMEENQIDHQIKLPNGKHFRAPAYTVEKQIVWGATAMMLSEFLAIIREIN